MTIHLTCHACSAPIDVDRDTDTVRCPWCDSVIVVPEALRKAGAMPQAPAASAERGASPPPANALGRVPRGRRGAAPTPAGIPVVIEVQRQRPGLLRRAVGSLFWVILILFITYVSFGPWWNSILSLTGMRTVGAGETASGMTAGERLSTLLNAGHATRVARFGSKGMGPGYFDDARAIAVDRTGRLYVGEYSSGRVQIFDEAGVFQGQWSFPKDSYVGSFVVDGEGRLYASVHTELQRHDAATGVLLDSLTAGIDDWVSSGLALAPDGRILVELDRDLVRMTPDGTVDLVIANAIEEASGDVEVSTALAVDGLGNIFAVATTQDVVYKFAPDGQYIDRFGQRDTEGITGEGLFSLAGAIVVDGQGRVYVGDIDGIQVFDNNGRYLDLIEVDGYPYGLAFNATGDLFVAAGDHVERFRINPP